MIKLSLYILTTTFAFSILPISIAVIHTINCASAGVLSHISATAINNAFIGYGIALGLSAIIIAAGLASWVTRNQAYTPFYLNMIGLGLAVSGLATCGFLLDTLNKIKCGMYYNDIFTTIAHHDHTLLQNISPTEPILIAGVVVFSLLAIGLIGLSIHKHLNDSNYPIPSPTI